MDIFIEPVMPRPELLVCGASPVAVAVAGLARIVGLTAVIAAPAEEHGRFGEVDGASTRAMGSTELGPAERYIVVADPGPWRRGGACSCRRRPAPLSCLRWLSLKAAALRELLSKKGCDGGD